MALLVPSGSSTFYMRTICSSATEALSMQSFCMHFVYFVAFRQARTKASREGLIAALRSAPNVLSATGEYWLGAKRTRDLLHDPASKVLSETAASVTQFSGKSLNRVTTRQTGARDVPVLSPPSNDVLMRGSSGEPQTHDEPVETGWPQHSGPEFPLEYLCDEFGLQDGGAGFRNKYSDFSSLFASGSGLPGAENAIPDLGHES
ncbi:hypothetical protein LTR56_023575 [Elasticomyces elasticus]|nr:hypothetical protein LTR56_023575 [Elasticomyces elasticus]KAK4897909.1 hypothetical protein LTR49_027895 [Elasticomyces elasticus]